MFLETFKALLRILILKHKVCLQSFLKIINNEVGRKLHYKARENSLYNHTHNVLSLTNTGHIFVAIFVSFHLYFHLGFQVYSLGIIS